MSISMKRVAAAATLLSACALLSGCPGDPPGGGQDDAPAKDAATLTVKVQMTGLLLVVPPKATNGPTHVLMPETGTLEPHVALLAFASATKQPYCAYWKDEVCFVNMDGWWLEPVSAAQTKPVKLPRGTLNLTGPSKQKVHPNRLGENPGRSVRSRITLRAGEATDSCSLARWTFNAASGQPIPLTNLLTWTIPNVPRTSITLTRHRLDRATGEPGSQALGTLTPDAEGVVDMLLMHVPLAEISDLTGGSETAKAEPQKGELATHYHAFYDLLRAKAGDRPLPRFEVKETACYWSVTNASRVSVGRGIKTYGCMLASAEPGP